MNFQLCNLQLKRFRLTCVIFHNSPHCTSNKRVQQILFGRLLLFFFVFLCFALLLTSDIPSINNLLNVGFGYRVFSFKKL